MPSGGLLFVSSPLLAQDVRSLQFAIVNQQQGKKGSEVTGAQRDRELEHLEAVVHYCELSDGCRRRFLLKHFGERFQRPATWTRQRCCDLCPDDGLTVRYDLSSRLQPGRRSDLTRSDASVGDGWAS